MACYVDICLKKKKDTRNIKRILSIIDILYGITMSPIYILLHTH